MSSGAHLQPACTLLEKHMSKFMGCNLSEMVKHSLWALKEQLSAEEKLAAKGCSHWDCWGRLDSYQKSPRKGTTTQLADEPVEHEVINRSVYMLSNL